MKPESLRVTLPFNKKQAGAGWRKTVEAVENRALTPAVPIPEHSSIPTVVGLDEANSDPLPNGATADVSIWNPHRQSMGIVGIPDCFFQSAVPSQI
jgi:hypothetical protein